MAKTALKPKEWTPRGPFSLGVKAGNMIFIAGQIPQDNDGNPFAPGDVKEQTRVVIGKIKTILAEGGMTLDDVVSTTVYLQSLADYDEMNEVYSSMFKPEYPARATIRADLAGKGLLVEISAIAVKG
ncbi:deaminase [Sneathiella chungangensis]|uniref:Deaminase n=1 Tax=Sneathiella chungangensis TaxID=1418234 RepID=A0A845MIU5_9PROT|nr:RidA family protein [Sneathiella chungangensis]MZR23217.1 deaminase [Sneathiella chungangensis]